jgi:hypothetical protein
VTLEKCRAFRALEEPWDSLINTIRLARNIDWSRCLLLGVSHLFAVPVSVLWVRFEKKKVKLGCEKYFCRVTY